MFSRISIQRADTGVKRQAGKRLRKEANQMTMSDPIADMLTRIRNANTAKHDTVDIPASKMKLLLPIFFKRRIYQKL